MGRTVLSFKTAIDKLDHQEQRFQTALGCYLGAISAMQEYVIETTPELTSEHQLALRTLHGELCNSAELEALDKGRGTLIAALQDYRLKAADWQSQKEEDLRAMLMALGEAAEVLSGHNDRHSGRLKEFTNRLQVVARSTDLAQMRRDLTQEVALLRVADQSMWQDNQASVANMRTQLLDFKHRLEHAEHRASTDALTGLLNRGEGETQLRTKLEAGQLLSVILLDINGFKQINDRWGHTCGDQVLKSFSRVLAENVRPSDMVCRWGGDEFLVMVNGDETIAQQRAEQMRERLRRRYKVTALAKVFEVDVSASLGVAQARTGETPEDLAARADLNLYSHKRSGTEHPKQHVTNLKPVKFTRHLPSTSPTP